MHNRCHDFVLRFLDDMANTRSRSRFMNVELESQEREETSFGGACERALIASM